jgi:hypothetical protein
VLFIFIIDRIASVPQKESHLHKHFQHEASASRVPEHTEGLGRRERFYIRRVFALFCKFRQNQENGGSQNATPPR